MPTPYEGSYAHPVTDARTFSTEHATAAIVIGALVALILIRRGFRGVSVPGVGGMSL